MAKIPQGLSARGDRIGWWFEMWVWPKKWVPLGGLPAGSSDSVEGGVISLVVVGWGIVEIELVGGLVGSSGDYLASL